MRHVIAHDGIPVFALLLKSSGFSLKARYVNDVHLPRFAADCQTWSDQFCQSSNLYGTATRKQDASRGFKGFLPLQREHYIKKTAAENHGGFSDRLITEIHYQQSYLK